MLGGRLTQGGVVGVASVFITVLAHSLGSGALGHAFPSLTTITVLFVAASMIGAVALDGRKGWVPLAVLMVGMQVLFHLILVVTDSHHTQGFLPSTTMIFTHTVAALVIAAIICGADGIIVRWRAFWAMLCHRVEVTVALEPRRVACSAPIVIDAAALWSPSRSIARRGPPVLP